MKKILYTCICSCIFVGAILSCSKTTKGKLSNDWKVTAYSIIDNSSSGNSSYEKGSESTVIFSNTLTPSDTTIVKEGKINEFTFTINKDGTWSMVKDVVKPSMYVYSTMENKNIVLKQEGTWAFLQKNKTEDFVKNERVAFFTLKETMILSSTDTSGNIESNTHTDIYDKVSHSAIYIVKESTKDKLILENEVSATETSSDNDQSSYSSIFSLTLEKK